MSLLLLPDRVIDGTGAVLERHAVLAVGERIEAVEPESAFSGYAGDRLALPGATLMPGLVDCHVHLCFGAEPNPAEAVERMSPAAVAIRALAQARETLAGGVTSIRDCGGKDYIEFAVRDACNGGDFLGPTIRAAGRMICMTGGHGNRFGRVADGAEEVVKAVREQVHAGSDLIKIMATGGVMTPGVNPEDAHYSGEEMAAGIAEGHRFHRACASHAQGTEGILNAVRGGIDSIEHGIFMSERCICEMIESGTYLVPTLAALGNILSGASQVPAYVREKAERVADTHRESVASFYRAGGRIAMGTDAGTPFNRHGANAEELRLMAGVGMSPMDAIIASTAHGASLMRLEGAGTVEAGGVADLLAVDGNPLDDIERVADRAHHRLVLKAGRIAHRGGTDPALAMPASAAAE